MCLVRDLEVLVAASRDQYDHCGDEHDESSRRKARWRQEPGEHGARIRAALKNPRLEQAAGETAVDEDRRSPATDRNRLEIGFARALGIELRQAGRLDPAGRDAVDRDAVLPQLARQRLRP